MGGVGIITVNLDTAVGERQVMVSDSSAPPKSEESDEIVTDAVGRQTLAFIVPVNDGLISNEVFAQLLSLILDRLPLSVSVWRVRHLVETVLVKWSRRTK
jgi:hypothetical protein